MYIHTLNFIFSADVTIPDGMTVDSDLNGASPQFTFTCISTGGLATTVTWTRYSATVMGVALDNAETATYTHTLNVTGRLGEETTSVLCPTANHHQLQQNSVWQVLYIHCEVQYIIQMPILPQPPPFLCIHNSFVFLQKKLQPSMCHCVLFMCSRPTAVQS